MHIRLDLDSMTLDDLQDLETARFDPSAGVWKQVREIFARFAYESDADDAERIDFDEAMVRVGKLTLRQISELLDSFGKAMEEVADQAIPPTKAE